MAEKLHPLAVWGLVKEARTALADDRPLLVTGALAEPLAKELGRGGSTGAIDVVRLRRSGSGARPRAGGSADRGG